MTDATAMGDFIFGTLATTADRVEAVISGRAALSAPTLDIAPDRVRVTLTAGPDAPVADVILYYTIDGSDPLLDAPGTSEHLFHEYPPVWDTLIWGYLRRFEVTLPTALLHGNVIRCRAIGHLRDGQSIPAGKGQRLSSLLAQHPTPEWVQNAVIYHIFVDRFATPEGVPFATHEHLAGFYGGSLRGVTERIAYLADLGVTVLWLSPVFPSPSHHGYDATDFREIEPRLGTKADLKALIEAAHDRGLRVLLDFVPNHVSETHPFFVDARTDPDSPYRDYFTFTHWPDEYESFFGVKSLPQINNDHPAARRYVIESAVYWLREFGVDGFRLDYAYGPSHDFWADYYAAVKAANPDSFHVGEIVETPELLRSFSGRMDGALDFHFLQAVRKTFVYETMTLDQFDDWLRRHEMYFDGYAFTLPTFLDNHDMNRFLWAAQGDTRRLKLAALIQFTLPATPIIYYGTETGLSQERDIRQEGHGILEESRLPMNWSAIDADLLAFYKQLIAARKALADVLRGGRATVSVTHGQYVYGYYAEVGARFDGELSALILINFSTEPVTLSPDVSGTWRDLFTNEAHTEPALTVNLAPYTGTALIRDAR